MHLELRDVERDDLPILFEYQRDGEAVAMAAVRSRTWDEFVLHWQTKVLGDPRTCTRAITLEGALVGYVASWPRDDERMIAYWIARPCWGRGVATAALQAFLRVELRRPLHAEVAVHNLGSMRVLDKCGFVRTSEVPSVGPDGIGEHAFCLSA